MVFVIPVMEHWLECKIAQWVHHEEMIQWPTAPWSYGLYGVRHMLKDHSDSERRNLLLPYMCYSCWLAARDILHVPSQRQDSTFHRLCYTSHGALATTTNSSMGPLWGIDLTTHHTMRWCSTMELHLSPNSTFLTSAFRLKILHWAISHSSQCSTTGVTKDVVCAILSVGWCI